MPYKMKNGATAMYGPKAMMEKGPMGYKKGPMAMGVKDAATKDMPVIDIEKGKAEGESMGTTAMRPKGPMAKQTSAEHYAMNAQHDIKTGEGTKADIMYDVKKASEHGYNSSVKKAQPHKH
tara:strand:+ start:812 stop:1174 length:363 start_codon:yes stop_codon:yes gene_type:complete